MIIIGVTGLARTGKDLYCNIAKNILAMNGLVAKRYAFADELKREVEPFLRDLCGVDVWTQNTEIKTDIRDFLVWYGTTFWRKREPLRWVSRVEQSIENDDGGFVDVALISDVRYPNEGHWVHAKEGWLVHLSKYTKISPNGGKTWERIYQKAPNLEEEKNDPLVKKQSDFQIEWEDMINGGTIKINLQDLVHNMYLKELVFKSLQSCPSLSQRLTKL
jgi:hypothetical protein